MANDKIQVIMLMDVKNIWRKNEILNVAPAYAKNVLLAKGYAVVATKSMLDKIDRDKMKKQAGHDDLISQLESVIQMLKESGHTMNGKVSPAGKLYAKIDAKSIASSLSEKFGFVVDHNILKTNKIEHTGDHEIKLQFEKIKSSFILTIVWAN